MKQFTFKTLLIITFFLVATILVLSHKVFSPATIQDREAALIRELKELEQEFEQISSALESARRKDLKLKKWLEKVARENPDNPVGEEARRLLERTWGSEE
ncbi:MAG: hypothetical protein DRP71_09370 [Verrucomicrobia bacterium]|nr:MAG: hypothetical protein DRP71_09370 [Verrucomicrobiota bacterium]